MKDLARISIAGIGVVGPGLTGWRQGAAVLRGEQPYGSAPLTTLKPEVLSANTRRRTTQLIKLALTVAEEARNHSGIDARNLSSVFASAEGDTFIIDRLCTALSQPEKAVSPTLFHNSVYNAPAAYWSIAAGASNNYTSIAAGRASFSAGLLEAAAHVLVEQQPVLLVVYDTALPGPLVPFGYSQISFAVALVLTPFTTDTRSIAHLRLLTPLLDQPADELPAAFAALRDANVAAEALPLLRRLASGGSGIVRFSYLDGSVLPAKLVC